ncbi:hypothetical protein CMO88_00280 [Candidatus Woesearchaeota archaeon]|nr:hypothetical protein [Candidatus Woesearchaeota archaeon]|tara:strand:- start:1906 stop:2409 length:504 start_codon:yes stop_codon:yes gene_type:complete
MKPFFLFFILLITVMEANAAGIGIAPAELNFNLEKGKKQQKELTVYNLENHEVDFNVYSNANFLEFSYNGIVEGNGMEKIIVEANAEKLKEGQYEKHIYITASNGASGIKLNLGTAVKVNVQVFKINKLNTIVGILTTFAIIVLGMLAYLTATKIKLSEIIRKAVNY